MIKPETIEICILAGGFSHRMGRDKSLLRVGGRTLLGHVRAAAVETGWPVRVIRKDPIPRHGVVGGIIGVLQSTRAQAVVFLACDMPLIRSALIRKLVRWSDDKLRACFTHHERLFGFPFLIPRTDLAEVRGLIEEDHFSLQQLATRLNAAKYVPAGTEIDQLRNINTPGELEELRRWLATQGAP